MTRGEFEKAVAALGYTVYLGIIKPWKYGRVVGYTVRIGGGVLLEGLGTVSYEEALPILEAMKVAE